MASDLGIQVVPRVPEEVPSSAVLASLGDDPAAISRPKRTRCGAKTMGERAPYLLISWATDVSDSPPPAVAPSVDIIPLGGVAVIGHPSRRTPEYSSAHAWQVHA